MEGKEDAIDNWYNMFLLFWQLISLVAVTLQSKAVCAQRLWVHLSDEPSAAVLFLVKKPSENALLPLVQIITQNDVLPLELVSTLKWGPDIFIFDMNRW